MAEKAAKKTTRKGQSGTPSQDSLGAPPKRGDELTARERRCAALLCMGYTDSKIGRRLGPPFPQVDNTTVGEIIHSACTKLGVGRHGLILWMLDNLSAEERERQTRAAERRRADLLASGVLQPFAIRVAMAYVQPGQCDKSYKDLGERLSPDTPIKTHTIGTTLRQIAAHTGPDACVAKLVAILHLAPLSLNTADGEAPETETL